MVTKLVCVHCGRIGTRGFMILSGTGDGSRDSYVCTNTTACERRQGENRPAVVSPRRSRARPRPPADPLSVRGDDEPHFVRTEWNPWPLTARTRYVLWVALDILAAQLAEDVAEVREAGSVDKLEFPRQIDAFPWITHRQPPEWWDQVVKAAERMAEAMRTGERWNPRTPAEEAVLHVAATWEKDVVIDIIRNDPASLFAREFSELPEAGEQSDPDTGETWHEHDLAFGEVLPALAGDTDIEMLWDRSFDGIEDPDGEFAPPGMADLRPQSWQRYFDMYVHEPDMPSMLM